MPNDLVDAMVNMREAEAMALAQKMLDAGEDPLQVLERCREALEIVGKQFETGKYFLPELILSGEMLKQISKIARPFMRKESNKKAEAKGKVVIGSVKGDIHDIGKDIVVFLLDINGFEVHDLGVDVPAEKFVETISKIQPAVVGMSALLTTALESMKNTVDVIKNAGLRDQVKIMVGGGAVDEKVRKYADADAYGPDAVAAVNLSKEWVEDKG
ncbi:MAG: cobalamin-dependent protein [Desulfobacterales bacterium]|jgi:5-methyltetrahydrofolate--homocysteine methyltransferase|nr:cobalamin-dependent protein [Desulfobacterales bacterium]MDH3877641.1 cobalamin-dependent protein [Desulfobacterales bacterium]MDH4010495.1 cobalamin-dependent protein [Desulfobacterales bacterium]